MADDGTIFDLVVIGGGPGGYPAAIRAAQLGARVALVEKRYLGGTCLNEGCIPTKAFLKTAKILQGIQGGSEHGIDIPSYEFDVARMVARKDEVVQRLRGGVRQLLDGNGVQVYEGLARVQSSNRVSVQGDDGDALVLEAKKLLLAVGSTQVIPPIPGIDLPGVIGSRQALELQELPDSIIVVGGNVIGLEFACIFNAFGVEVTVLGRNPKLLKYLDGEISRRIRPVLRRSGITVLVDAPVKEIRGDGPMKRVVYEQRGQEKEAEASLVLNAAGRKPNIEQLPLDELGIETEAGAITVDEYMVTSNPDICAIGDAIGGMMLAHVATAEGLVAAESLYGEPRTLDPNTLPDVAFTLPEAAGVGLHEDEATETYPSVEVAKFSYAALGKAVATGDTDGMVKIVFDAQTRRVLGMHILGAEAPLLIHEGVLALETGMTVEQLGHAVHVHPTLSEAVMEAAHVGMGAPIHMLPR